ncbi:hypothetical protein DPMN_108691 [Dreissena polymorpha]|uniref:Uncharacterized protein n=1 Tax=Dreissena polymorpha TaxID=45954 RepID=A0A9D4K8Z2_DREPO|nr:hypothetical protein DPMN_108691 [Dreissena polymorpha]
MQSVTERQTDGRTVRSLYALLGGHKKHKLTNHKHTAKEIIRTNVLTKFHEDRTINGIFRVLTRFYFSHRRKNALPNGGHAFQQSGIIFQIIKDIITKNVLT